MRKKHLNFAWIRKLNKQLAIRYDIQYIGNAQGGGKPQEFVRLLDEPPIRDVQLEEKLQQRSSISKGGVRAVLLALQEVMQEELMDGRRFCIPGVGHFSLSPSLELPEGKTVEKVRAEYVGVKNVNFKPDKKMLEALKHKTRFLKTESLTGTVHYTAPEMEQMIKDYLSEHRYMTRRDMERRFYLTQYTAYKWLDFFVGIGVLVKDGTRHNPLYFLK